MPNLPITSTHLQIAQRIIEFVQAQGWDIEGIEIHRYDDNDKPFIGKDAADAWKGEVRKWTLRLSVAPRDDGTELVPKKEPA